MTPMTPMSTQSFYTSSMNPMQTITREPSYIAIPTYQAPKPLSASPFSFAPEYMTERKQEEKSVSSPGLARPIKVVTSDSSDDDLDEDSSEEAPRRRKRSQKKKRKKSSCFCQ